jgi:chaperonin GroEL
VIASGVEGEALATLVVNKISGVLPSVAVSLPPDGQGRIALEDLARECGAHPSALDGFPIELLSLRDLGQASRVVATSERTTIICESARTVAELSNAS